MVWVAIILAGVLQAYGGYHLAEWLFFRVHKSSHRLVFRTHTDGDAWRNSKGIMEPTMLTVALRGYLRGSNLPAAHLWLFQMTADGTEGVLTEYGSAQPDPERFAIQHVFLCPDFFLAVEQIKALREAHRRPPPQPQPHSVN